MPKDGHYYVSTACAHRQCGSCRQTCKYCGDPCHHGCHEGDPPKVVSPVDEARDIARLLYAELGAGISGRLAATIEADPGLFWLREGEVPPGEWSQPGD